MLSTFLADPSHTQYGGGNDRYASRPSIYALERCPRAFPFANKYTYPDTQNEWEDPADSRSTRSPRSQDDDDNDDDDSRTSISITIFIVAEVFVVLSLIMSINTVLNWRDAGDLGGSYFLAFFILCLAAAPFVFAGIITLLDILGTTSQLSPKWPKTALALDLALKGILGSAILGLISYYFVQTYYVFFLDFPLDLFPT